MERARKAGGILGRTVLMVALTATLLGFNSTLVSAADYSGPLGTRLSIGTITCYTSNASWDPTFRKQVLLEGIGVYPTSTQVFANVRWTVWLYNQGTGSYETPWTEVGSWGSLTGSPTYVLPSYSKPISSAFSGPVYFYERLEFLDAAGRTIAGTTLSFWAPQYTTRITAYPGIDQVWNGYCVFPRT